MFRSLFILSFILVLFSPIAWAQLPSEIELESHSIEYTNNNRTIIARDEVVLTYKGYQVHSDYFIFDSESGDVSFPDDLMLQNDYHLIKAKNLNYNFHTHKGTATDLDAKIHHLTMTGKNIGFLPGQLSLNQATYTGCDHKNPHYKIYSDNIDVYYSLGFFVAKRNYFEFQYLPFRLPVPYYIYGEKKYAFLGVASFFPEIGKNNIEGNYARYRSSYLINERSSGTGEIGYTEHLGWVFGGTNIYRSSPQVTTVTKALYYPLDQTTSALGMINYAYSLPASTSPSENIFDALISNFQESSTLPHGDIFLLAQHRSIVNDYWVSYLPMVQFNLKNYPLFSRFPEVDYFNTTSLAKVKQEGNDEDSIDIFRGIISNSLYYETLILPRLTLFSEFNNNLHIYSSYENWNRASQSLGTKFDIFMNPTIEYINLFLNDGSTPLGFESEYAQENDEIGFSISEQINHFKVGQSSYWDLEKESFRELDFNFSIVFHCWAFGFHWETQKNAFSFAFELL